MDKIEALEEIKTIWNAKDSNLGKKIIKVSSSFYDAGLDISTTAAYINATPAELDALLALGGLEDNLINLIGEINPPKTTWQLLASASEEEIKQALNALAENREKTGENRVHSALSEFIYQQMIEVAGPTSEQRVGMIAGSDLAIILKKSEDFKALSDWDKKFFKSVTNQKKRGKTLSCKQLPILYRILTDLADKGVIVRNSIDGDQEVCDRVLDAIGKE